MKKLKKELVWSYDFNKIMQNMIIKISLNRSKLSNIKSNYILPFGKNKIDIY